MRGLKILLLLNLCLIATLAKAQWTDPGSDGTGTIYYNNGNVGIGTTSPDAKITVFSTTSGLLGRFGSLANGGVSGLRIQGKDNSGVNKYLDLAFNPVSGMYGFGVGRNSGELPISSGFGQADFVVDGNGFMGIGTTVPRQRLHVRGGIYIEGTESYATGWNISRLQWKGHSLVMGTEAGRYAHNKLELKPGGSSNGPLHSLFEMYSSPGENEHEVKIRLHSDGASFLNGGNVGIGTTDTKGYKLAVAGKIVSEEVVVKLQSSWPDYVFEESYPLTPLQDLETYLKENKHLPGIPNAKTVEEEGIQLGEMNAKLLEKVEELTLYIIELEKRIKSLENE